MNFFQQYFVYWLFCIFIIAELSLWNDIYFFYYRGHITDNEQSYYIEPAAEGRYHKFYIEPDTRPSVFHSEGL